MIGYEVPWPLLDAIADVPEAALHRGLAHLQAAEFLYETRLFPEREWMFTHALTQEVAYGGLLQERRQGLHARIVEALEALAAERLTEYVDRLAHHAVRGAVWDKALAYCRQAGEKAMARSAHREAVGYFEQALRALAHLPEQCHTREQAIDLRLALGTALSPSGTLERILATLREAEGLAEALDDPRRLGRISVNLSNHFRRMGAYDQAIAAGQRALALATARGRSSCRRWRTSTSASPTWSRATIGGRSTASGRPWRPSTRRGAMNALGKPSSPPCNPVPCSPGVMPSWARSLKAGPSATKGSGSPRQLLTPRAV